MAASPHTRRNREVWDGMSEWYQPKHGPQLNSRPRSPGGGVAQSEISRIERGSVHPTDTTWSRLAAALGAEVRLVAVPAAPRAAARRRARSSAQPAPGRRPALAAATAARS